MEGLPGFHGARPEKEFILSSKGDGKKMLGNSYRWRLLALGACLACGFTARGQESLLPAGGGRLYRYEGVSRPKGGRFDYWLYLSGDGKAQGGTAHTLYDSTALDGTGILLTDYVIDAEGSRILSSRTLNLKPASAKAWKTRYADYDYGARKLRSAYGIGDAAPAPLGYPEAIPYAPTVWQRDLGLHFSLFFPKARPGAAPFIFCYDSYGHLIFMEARELGGGNADGMEYVDGIACRKYGVKGQGLWTSIIGQGGYVWVAEDGGERFMVKHSMRMGFSWTMRDFSMELKERKSIRDEDWLALQTTLSEGILP
jgi:hypothetical protein